MKDNGKIQQKYKCAEHNILQSAQFVKQYCICGKHCRQLCNSLLATSGRTSRLRRCS